MVAAEAEHPNCAYKWLDWIVSPGGATPQVAEWFGEAPANAKACDLDRGHGALRHATTPPTRRTPSKIWYWTHADRAVPRRPHRRRVHRLRRRGPRPGPRSRADRAALAERRSARRRDPTLSRRASAFLHRHLRLRLLGCCWPRRCSGWSWPTSASLAALFVTAFWTTDSFTSEVVRDVDLDNFRTLVTSDGLPHVILRTLAVALRGHA